MIDVTRLRTFVCTTPTKMSASFDTLMGRAREVFDQDPTSGHLFLFFNRRRDRLKILFWDRDGFCIYYKRLEVGTFPVLTTTSDPEGIEIEYWQLVQLLDGVDLNTGRRRRRYRRSGRNSFFADCFCRLDLRDPDGLLQPCVRWMTRPCCPTIPRNAIGCC